MSGYVWCIVPDCFEQFVGERGDYCDSCIKSDCEDSCNCECNECDEWKVNCFCA